MRCRCAFRKVFGLVLTFPFLTYAGVFPDGLYAEFSTSMGDFTCELDYTGTPRTVANFVQLTEGERVWGVDRATGTTLSNAFYEGVVFHRVITNFVIQAGRPNAPASVTVGYTFSDEFGTASSTNVDRGVLAMANAGRDTNASQFFIPVVDKPSLDGIHTVFGRVVDGMDVVDAINLVPTENQEPVTPVTINSLSILREGAAAQAWEPGAVSPPLPEPVFIPTNITNENGTLVVYWGRQGGLTTHSFDTSDLCSDDPVGYYNGTWSSGSGLAGYQDEVPSACFWTIRHSKD